jgi:hypothetical protein
MRTMYAINIKFIHYKSIVLLGSDIVLNQYLRQRYDLKTNLAAMRIRTLQVGSRSEQSEPNANHSWYVCRTSLVCTKSTHWYILVQAEAGRTCLASPASSSPTHTSSTSVIVNKDSK